MCSLHLTILLLFFAQASAKELTANYAADAKDFMDTAGDDLIGKIFDRSHKACPRHHTRLDETTMAKTKSGTYKSAGTLTNRIVIPCAYSKAFLWRSLTFPSFCSPCLVAVPQSLRVKGRGRKRDVTGKAFESIFEDHLSIPPYFDAYGRITISTPPPRVKSDAVSEYTLIASGTLKPHPAKVDKNGEDAWFFKTDKYGGGVVAVADGVGGCNLAGVDPALYASVLSYEVAEAYEKVQDLKGAIAIAQEETRLPGAATLCVVEVQGTKLRAANVGDSGFRIIRGGAIVFASPVLQHGFNFPYQLTNMEINMGAGDTAEDAEIFDFPVQSGDLVVTATDGLFDNVYDDDIAKVATEAAMRGTDALTATRAASEALVTLARKHAEDTEYDSPFIIEWNRYMQASLGESAQEAGFSPRSGGKLDDITVVVGVVLRTDDLNKKELKQAAEASEKLSKSMFVERERALKIIADEEADRTRENIQQSLRSLGKSLGIKGP